MCSKTRLSFIAFALGPSRAHRPTVFHPTLECSGAKEEEAHANNAPPASIKLYYYSTERPFTFYVNSASPELRDSASSAICSRSGSQRRHCKRPRLRRLPNMKLLVEPRPPPPVLPGSLHDLTGMVRVGWRGGSSIVPGSLHNKPLPQFRSGKAGCCSLLGQVDRGWNARRATRLTATKCLERRQTA